MTGEVESDEEVIAFARAAVGSVSALELLILLRHNRPRGYRIGELVRELRSSQLAVAHALNRLTKFGMVEEQPQQTYGYQTRSPQLDDICERLESVYARKPVSLIRAILEAPDEKLRAFADAFRLLIKGE